MVDSPLELFNDRVFVESVLRMVNSKWGGKEIEPPELFSVVVENAFRQAHDNQMSKIPIDPMEGPNLQTLSAIALGMHNVMQEVLGTMLLIGWESALQYLSDRGREIR